MKPFDIEIPKKERIKIVDVGEAWNDTMRLL